MPDNLREFLYPLGFLASLAFGSRMLLQWLSSEWNKKSMVTRGFWQLSLVGNLLLMVHTLIQLQFHVCVVQACNAVISWRNLNLMSTRPLAFRNVVAFLILAVSAVTAVFFLQSQFFFDGSMEWFRIPVVPWSNTLTVPFYYHLIGFAGIALFASRFWVQWWYAEKHQKSQLGNAFWWISLIGDFLSLLYFAQIKDAVNLIGPALGLIPYIRNLMLIYRAQSRLISSE